jgi:hypothetical protein
MPPCPPAAIGRLQALGALVQGQGRLAGAPHAPSGQFGACRLQLREHLCLEALPCSLPAKWNLPPGGAIIHLMEVPESMEWKPPCVVTPASSAACPRQEPQGPATGPCQSCAHCFEQYRHADNCLNCSGSGCSVCLTNRAPTASWQAAERPVLSSFCAS